MSAAPFPCTPSEHRSGRRQYWSGGTGTSRLAINQFQQRDAVDESAVDRFIARPTRYDLPTDSWPAKPTADASNTRADVVVRRAQGAPKDHGLTSRSRSDADPTSSSPAEAPSCRTVRWAPLLRASRTATPLRPRRSGTRSFDRENAARPHCPPVVARVSPALALGWLWARAKAKPSSRSAD
jgi:hypothetical protein